LRLHPVQPPLLAIGPMIRFWFDPSFAKPRGMLFGGGV
jgi:hypothetical protein